MVAMATQESKEGITRDGVAWTVAIAGSRNSVIFKESLLMD